MSVSPLPSVDQLDLLRRRLSELGRVVVAFSGGADSAFLAWVANDTLGPARVRVATAVSPSLAAVELEDCRRFVEQWGMRWTTVETHELDDLAYRRNGGDRCFHCKDALMSAFAPIAASEHATVVLGVNVDDLGDHRPGQDAARKGGGVFPLVDAGFTKQEVRVQSRLAGLTTWDKPAAACLASRIPYGTPVTLGVLRSVEGAEAAIRDLGFRALRVRHYGDAARLEVPIDELERVIAQREAVVSAVKAAGYRYVTVDLEGLRSGNLNAALGDR